MEITLTATVLGKRRASSQVGVIHLASSPEPTGKAEPAKPPILINGKLVPNTKRRYQCTHPGCVKAYSKPSRLEEHQRSHTGERPFVCEMCQKSYLRDTHLQAHVRTHLPESSRPLSCDVEDCKKRFWTSQHLRAHQDWHNGAKPFACLEDDCHEAFSKHHQLRSHICEAHAPPGTKPYRCDHEGCSKSFDTNQHLKTHLKTHNAKRYTCVHTSCLAQTQDLPAFFPTWTALQHHIRSSHPPTCIHSSCDGRVFASQKGLRSHQKLHDQHDTEEQLLSTLPPNEVDQRPTKKPRRGGDIGRDWKCDFEDCDKDFKSKKALNTHTNVTHLGKRDFVCSECPKAFGYKHLLQRHTAKIHTQPSSEQSDSADQGGDDEDDDGEDDNGSDGSESDTMGSGHIDLITGKAYADRTSTSVRRATAFICPFPALDGLVVDEDDEGSSPISPSKNLSVSASPCDYAFSRLYDLRRHLKAVHHVKTDRDRLQSWMASTKKILIP